MGLPGFLKRLLAGNRPGRAWSDETHLRLPGLDIVVKRSSGLKVPHEITVIVPRMEVRVKADPAGGSEIEYILSSVTVSHSPRPSVDGAVDQC